MSNKTKILTFDLETEGLNLVTSRPWSIAYSYGGIGKNAKLVEHDVMLKWDDLNISKGAAKVTGFNKAFYLKQAVDPKPELERFLDLLADKNTIITGLNILNFDVFILKVWAKSVKVDFDFDWITKCLDARCLAIAEQTKTPPPDEYSFFDGDPNFLGWQYSLLGKRRKGIKSNSAFLLKKYGIDFDPDKLHDALYDVQKTREIFNYLTWKMEIELAH